MVTRPKHLGMDVIGVGLVVAEACACGIDDPGVVSGAGHAGVQSKFI